MNKLGLNKLGRRIETHHWRELVYIERNPVRARLCRKAWRWRWSSAAGYSGLDNKSGLLDLSAWQKQMDAARWRDLLTRADDERQLARFRLCTSRGRPLGSDKFVARIETFIGRRLSPLPHGRPIKKLGPSPIKNSCRFPCVER